MSTIMMEAHTRFPTDKKREVGRACMPQPKPTRAAACEAKQFSLSRFFFSKSFKQKNKKKSPLEWQHGAHKFYETKMFLKTVLFCLMLGVHFLYTRWYRQMMRSREEKPLAVKGVFKSVFCRRCVHLFCITSKTGIGRLGNKHLLEWGTWKCKIILLSW